MNEKFIILPEERAGRRTYYLKGELDLSTAPDFRQVMDQVVRDKDKSIVLDLTELKYMDSTGIGVIISILKVRNELDAPFEIRNVPPKIKRLFDLTGISKFLDISGNVQPAEGNDLRI